MTLSFSRTPESWIVILPVGLAINSIMNRFYLRLFNTIVLTRSYGPMDKGVCVKAVSLPCYCMWARAQFLGTECAPPEPENDHQVVSSNLSFTLDILTHLWLHPLKTSLKCQVPESLWFISHPLKYQGFKHASYLLLIYQLGIISVVFCGIFRWYRWSRSLWSMLWQKMRELHSPEAKL